jgi:membrane protein YdbS with pleckstrin-like domain
VPLTDRIQDDDEEVVVHLHPHWRTLSRSVALAFLLVGAGSFGAAAVPPGQDRPALRAAVAGLAALLVLVLVARPVLRWVTTHYVLTPRTLSVRRGILGRSSTDVPLSAVLEVTCRQTLGERLVGAGTVHVTSNGGALTLEDVPRCRAFRAWLLELADVEDETGADAPSALLPVPD